MEPSGPIVDYLVDAWGADVFRRSAFARLMRLENAREVRRKYEVMLKRGLKAGATGAPTPAAERGASGRPAPASSPKFKPDPK